MYLVKAFHYAVLKMHALYDLLKETEEDLAKTLQICFNEGTRKRKMDANSISAPKKTLKTTSTLIEEDPKHASWSFGDPPAVGSPGVSMSCGGAAYPSATPVPDRLPDAVIEKVPERKMTGFQAVRKLLRQSGISLCMVVI